MKPKNKLSPYPILAGFRDDYIGSSFLAEIDTTTKFGSLEINVCFQLDDQALIALIEQGRAAYVIHIECSKTSYRHVEIADEEEFDFLVSQDELEGTVEVCTFVTAIQDIDDFRSENFHPDYADVSFRIKKGNQLAVGNALSIQIVKDDNDLERLPSIINVYRNVEKDADAICVNTQEGKYILVGLSDEVFKLYSKEGQGRMSDTVFALVILPALMVVLSRMSEENEEDQEKHWYQVIRGQLEKNGLTPSDLSNDDVSSSVISVAQGLFNDPIKRGLLEIQKCMEDE